MEVMGFELGLKDRIYTEMECTFVENRKYRLVVGTESILYEKESRLNL